MEEGYEGFRRGHVLQQQAEIPSIPTFGPRLHIEAGQVQEVDFWRHGGPPPPREKHSPPRGRAAALRGGEGLDH